MTELMSAVSAREPPTFRLRPHISHANPLVLVVIVVASSIWFGLVGRSFRALLLESTPGIRFFLSLVLFGVGFLPALFLLNAVARCSCILGEHGFVLRGFGTNVACLTPT